MLNIIKSHTQLIVIQILLFSILFSGVLIISSIIFSKTTIYSEKKSKFEKPANLEGGVEKFFKDRVIK